jgi:hypothetical protein
LTLNGVKRRELTILQNKTYIIKNSLFIFPRISSHALVSNINLVDMFPFKLEKDEAIIVIMLIV